MFDAIKQYFENIASGGALALVKALAILVAGLVVVRLIVGLVRSVTIKTKKLDNAASTFVTSLTKIVLYVLLAIWVLGTAGVDTTSLVAAFAAVSLAISLGLQDTLSGLTNGIIIIFTKPFKQGDYIKVGDTEGTVKEIRLFNTKLTTPDNLDIIIPNSTVLSNDLTNFSSMPLRRIEFTLPVPYETEVEQVKKVVLETIQKDKRIVKTPEPMCRLKEYGDSALNYTVRAWVKSDIYWDVRFDLLENLFSDLRKNGIEIPFNQLDVHVIDSEKKED